MSSTSSRLASLAGARGYGFVRLNRLAVEQLLGPGYADVAPANEILTSARRFSPPGREGPAYAAREMTEETPVTLAP